MLSGISLPKAGCIFFSLCPRVLPTNFTLPTMYQVWKGSNSSHQSLSPHLHLAAGCLRSSEQFLFKTNILLKLSIYTENCLKSDYKLIIYLPLITNIQTKTQNIHYLNPRHSSPTPLSHYHLPTTGNCHFGFEHYRLAFCIVKLSFQCYHQHVLLVSGFCSSLYLWHSPMLLYAALVNPFSSAVFRCVDILQLIHSIK